MASGTTTNFVLFYFSDREPTSIRITSGQKEPLWAFKIFNFNIAESIYRIKHNEQSHSCGECILTCFSMNITAFWDV
jgi:hypothetical protein